jgi:hypothetical protein
LHPEAFLFASPPPPKLAASPDFSALGLSPDRPLVVVDVDEVLGLFMKGFGDFLAGQYGLELRVERYALFQNIFRPQAAEPLPEADGKALFHAFFRTHCGEMEPAPGAIAALGRLHRTAEIVILSNAPPEAEALRVAWLRKHGLSHPLLLNTGPKGPITAALVGQSRGRSAFIDDILVNLDSVADHAPQTATFQHVADTRLQALAPTSTRHRRIDDWAELALAVEEAVAG